MNKRLRLLMGVDFPVLVSEEDVKSSKTIQDLLNHPYLQPRHTLTVDGQAIGVLESFNATEIIRQPVYDLGDMQQYSMSGRETITFSIRMMEVNDAAIERLTRGPDVLANLREAASENLRERLQDTLLREVSVSRTLEPGAVRIDYTLERFRTLASDIVSERVVSLSMGTAVVPSYCSHCASGEDETHEAGCPVS